MSNDYPLTKYEVEVLRVAAGEDVPGFFWGAWVSACLSSLRSKGLVRLTRDSEGYTYEATDEGRAIVAEIERLDRARALLGEGE